MATETAPNTLPEGFVLTITPTAASEVAKFLAAPDVPQETAGLRISVMPGGCSGFKYSLNIEDNSVEDDITAEIAGVRVFIDSFSAQYLNGVTIDYVSSMQGSGFTFNNPNAVGGCGCGSSFAA
jgi:iron-sulfur cluster assembly accessory protein